MRNADSRFNTFIVVTGAVFLATGIQELARGSMGPVITIFMIPVVVAAWMGGLVLGLGATLLCALAVNWSAMVPLHSIYTDHSVDRLRLLTFAASGAMVSAIVASMRASRRRLEEEVTFRLAAEEAARREREAHEQRFRTLVDNVPVMIWLNGPTGCEFVNREYLRVLGLPLERVLGMAWADTVHPEDREGYLEAYRRAVEARGPFEAEVRLRCAHGGYRIFRSNGSPRLREDGALQGYVGSTMDITEMAHSREALRTAAARKDEFIAMLAHELRNPLAPLSNGIFLLENEQSDPALRDKALTIMRRQLGHLTRMVDDLLDVSRITRGKLELRRERVDLSRIVQEAVEMSRPLIDSMRHTLSVTLPGRPVWVDGDPVRLGQVLANLLNNAAKYTPAPGDIMVQSWLDGSQACVSVRDSGEGITPEELPSVFEMFYQSHPPGSVTMGLGIGLALVKQLVEMHGGSVEARSEGPGRGSEFLVRLPCAAGPRQIASGLPAAAPSSVPRAAETAHVFKVLVADDNEDVLTTVKEVVEHLGSECRVARDGAEALSEARRYRPDLVLMDIGMPRMDGLETARRMRREPWGREILLVAVTGWGQAEDRRRSREAGFDHHMVKPVDPAQLAGLLVALSSRSLPRGETPPS